ncbi:hypothetical protein ACFPN2_38435 [Steroidobacter flavus]|uniref:Uncharacterized protein n=1 Tax=Steroidobacter flavus TaxID=1842136 RepID=A0ABV8T774_9GAMM
MSARHLTVTCLGLSLRTELRLKSMLEVVNARTTDRWSFTERGDAHVAICDPASALSSVTQKRSSNGATRFFSLVEDVALAASGTSVIRDPIRASDLIELLNLVSSTLSLEVPPREWAALASTEDAAVDGRNAFPVAVALRGLARRDAQQVYALQAASVELNVVPETRSVLLTRPLDESGLARLAAPGVHISIREWPTSHARLLADTGAQSCKLDALLWRLALHGCKSRLLPELPPSAHFKLRRWPDFGRIEHTPDHLRLAARLVRQKMTVLELAIVTRLPVSTINAFINACCLIELLEVHSDGPKHSPVDARPSRYAGIFNAIRSVLRLGASS